jgi:hypothetical protein
MRPVHVSTECDCAIALVLMSSITQRWPRRQPSARITRPARDSDRPPEVFTFNSRLLDMLLI